MWDERKTPCLFYGIHEGNISEASSNALDIVPFMTDLQLNIETMV